MKEKNKKMILGGLIIVLIVLIGGFYFKNNTKKVTQSVSDVHSLYTEYAGLVKKIGEHLDRNSGSDSDSLERYALEGKIIIDEESSKRDALLEKVSSLNTSDTKSYVEVINKYLENTERLMEFEKANVEISAFYVEPVRQTEDIEVDAGGAGVYMYSDPDKYVSIMQKAIVVYKEVLNTFKGYTPPVIFADLHNSLISYKETEIKFISNMSNAVSRRDVESIASVSRSIVQEAQNFQKEYGRLVDITDAQIKEVISNVSNQKEVVDNEYTFLRNKLNF